MPVTYQNFKGQSYYLHRGQTKAGKDRYYFSQKIEGPTCDTLPEGYEIYEHPNAQVFLRKIPKKIIADAELALLEQAIKKHTDLPSYKVDVRKDKIQIYTPDQHSGLLEGPLSGLPLSPAQKSSILSIGMNFSPAMQFVLVDKKKRTFMVQRYCFRGSIDDWIVVGGPDSLEALAENFVKHLGKESFFDLF
jgi:hypothetical protein